MEYKDLKTLFSANEKYYSEMMAQMRVIDKLYKREFKLDIPLPENIRVHKSSRPSHIVDSLRDQIRVDEPVVIYHTSSKSQVATKHKATMQIWGIEMLRGIVKLNISDPIAQAPHDLLLRGAACWKTMVTDEALNGEPVFPFFVKALDPLQLFPSPGTGPLKYMLEKQTRRVMDMHEQYPGWKDPKGKALSDDLALNPLREVEWLELWSPDEYKVEPDGDPMINRVNPYGGIIPHIYRYSGLGRVDADGNPKHLAISILASIEGELEAEIEAKTAMRAAWMFHVFDRLLTTGDPKVVARQFQKGPGAVIGYKQGDEPPQWMEKPQPSGQIMNWMAEIDKSIGAEIPASLTERAADFGIHQALLIGQALKIISPVKKSLNSMGTELLNQLSRLMEFFDLSMTLENGTVVRGSVDFSDHNFEVKFEAVDRAEDDRRMLAAIPVRRGGDMSRQTYTEEYLSSIIPDPEEEEIRLLVEQAVQQMMETGALTGALLEKWQVDRGEEQLAEVESQVASTVRQDRLAGSTDIGSNREKNIEQVSGGGQVPTETADTGFTQGGV